MSISNGVPSVVAIQRQIPPDQRDRGPCRGERRGKCDPGGAGSAARDSFWPMGLFQTSHSGKGPVYIWVNGESGTGP